MSLRGVLPQKDEEAISKIEQGLTRSCDSMDLGQLELAAEDIQETLQGAAELLGEGLSLDVLDRIFEEFCVGK